MRLLGAMAVACASVPVMGAGPAHADTTVTITASNFGYFYSGGIDKPEQSPAAPPNVTGQYADGVAAGNLGVASSGGQEEKVSFLAFDVAGLPAGATISKAVVTLTLVPSSPPTNISYNAAPELVAACKAGDEGFFEDDGAGLATSAPSRLCDKFQAKGKALSPTAWQFDITGLASEWLAGTNDGLAITRALDATTPFQVVFGPAKTAKLAVTYSAPVEVLPPTTPTVPEVPVTPDLGGGIGSPVVPDVGSGFVPEAPAPAVPEPAVGAPTAPQAPVTGQPATRPVALSSSMTPTTGFWVGGLALAAVLALVSLVLGDQRRPVAATSRSRLTQALENPQHRMALRTRPV